MGQGAVAAQVVDGEGCGPAPRRITASDVAERLGVTRRTVYNLIKIGLLHPVRSPWREWQDFDPEEVAALAKTYRKFFTVYMKTHGMAS